MEVDAFLDHHGVKGQRWGVRNRKQAKKLSTESKRAGEVLKKAKKHGVRSLTNKELGDLNKRLELERKFSQVGPKSSIKKGANFAKSVLSTGQSINNAIAFANSPAGKAVAGALKKKKK